MHLHHVFSAAIEAAKKANRPSLSSGTIDNARTIVDDGAKLLGEGPQIESVEHISIPSRAGKMNGVIYKPKQSTPGLIVYFHGGGWVAGSASSFDALGRTLAARSGCSLLMVDYRLAPENPFPSGLEDAEDAIRWASEHLLVLAGENARLVIAGDSAGANLATVAALALREQIEIALQLLFYPVTDCNMETSSYREYAEGLPLARKDMQWFYLNYASASQWQNPKISPLRADVTGAPPAWIGIAEYDVLRSEGVAYANLLEKAGVPVQWKIYPDLTHGFARWFNLVDSASLAIDDAVQVIRFHCNQTKTLD